MILEKNSDPESREMLKVLSVNLRVLKHSERVTYRGGELPNQEPTSLEEMKSEESSTKVGDPLAIP